MVADSFHDGVGAAAAELAGCLDSESVSKPGTTGAVM